MLLCLLCTISVRHFSLLTIARNFCSLYHGKQPCQGRRWSSFVAAIGWCKHEMQLGGLSPVEEGGQFSSPYRPVTYLASYTSPQILIDLRLTTCLRMNGQLNDDMNFKEKMRNDNILSQRRGCGSVFIHTWSEIRRCLPSLSTRDHGGHCTHSLPTIAPNFQLLTESTSLVALAVCHFSLYHKCPSLTTHQ